MIETSKKTSTDHTVALTRCDDYDHRSVAESVSRQFQLLGGADKFISRCDRVLLKPNFIVPRPPTHPAQTHPALILAVATIVKDLGAKPIVADSPAWNTFRACLKALDLDRDLKKLGIEAVPLNRPKRCQLNRTSVGISKVALEADSIINLPKLKTHQQLGATFAVKNMFGCVCGKEKALKHFTLGNSTDHFCRMLLDIYQFLAPVLTIIDGVVAMEGMGPINGTPKKLGFFVGSTSPIAAELLCCKLTKIDPKILPIIQTAKKISFGPCDIEHIKVIGDDPDELICHDFKPSQQTPLEFSLPRVCKSVAKQLIYITKSAVTGKNTD